jgi:hypothetical protein
MKHLVSEQNKSIKILRAFESNAKKWRLEKRASHRPVVYCYGAYNVN